MSVAKDFLRRWRYRWITWFHDRPNALGRRVQTENILWKAALSGKGLTARECGELAKSLGCPAQKHTKELYHENEK